MESTATCAVLAILAAAAPPLAHAECALQAKALADSRGLIATAGHPIGDPSSITVLDHGLTEGTADLVAFDQRIDVALCGLK